MCLGQIVLKTYIDAVNYQQTCDQIINLAHQSISAYIIPANVHVVMTAYGDHQYRKVVEDAYLVTPDGMPLVWALRLLGIKDQTRVYGPDLMLFLCQRAAREKIPVFLYGGTVAVLKTLQHNLENQFPDLVIVGSHSPPFRVLTSEEENTNIQKIRESRAKIVFVALGCPKQEIWMAQHFGKLPAVMIGVGAAFNFHAGVVRQSPRWLMKLGLEWFYRLLMEPRRLWQRYFFNNPAFIILFGLQLSRFWLKKYLANFR